MMIGKDIATHQIGGQMIAATSGKIANSQETIIDGTIGKKHQLSMTTVIKIGSNDPNNDLTGTRTNLVGTMITDGVIGHINMDTTEFLKQS